MSGRRFGWPAVALLFATACSDMLPGVDGNVLNAPVDASDMQQSVEDDLPACSNVLTSAEAERQDRTDGSAVNRLEVRANGRFGWNDSEIDAATLGQYLELVSQMTPEPTLVVTFESGVTPSARSDLAKLIGQTLNCRAEAI